MDKIDKTTLVYNLKALGLGRGDWLAVHSSMKAIGWVEGGAPAVLEALIEVLGPEGLLMLPLFNSPGPGIDLSVTPTRLGLIPETFRTWPGVVRSPHPTHSVGLHGRRAAEIAEGHRQATFVGRGSPFHRLAENGGWVLHLGTDFNSSSILHLAEVLAGVPYLDISYPDYMAALTCRATDGSLVAAVPREVPGDSVKFILVQEKMAKAGLLRTGRVGNAPSVLAKAADMLETAVSMMRENPRQFLCDDPDCPACGKAHELVTEWELTRRKEEASNGAIR